MTVFFYVQSLNCDKIKEITQQVICLLHVFIVNPAAGKGKALQMAEQIKKRFEGFSQPYEIKITQYPGHATILAEEALKADQPVRIYSVGGDGTLNEIVNGMAGSQAELGVIPCGSGNDTVRSLYKIVDPIKLIDVLPVSSTALIDLGRFNGKYFINIASIGFDAEVVLKSRIFRRSPLISGSMAYILGVLTAVLRMKKYRLRISVDQSETIEKDTLLSIFANGSFYGGGMLPAPMAKMDDGLLDFCFVDKVTRLKLLRFFPAFIKGKHVGMKEVHISRGIRTVVESDIPFPYNIDGEVFTGTSAVVELIPDYLNVLVPVEK